MADLTSLLEVKKLLWSIKKKQERMKSETRISSKILKGETL
jgi:hypothetical protein